MACRAAAAAAAVMCVCLVAAAGGAGAEGAVVWHDARSLGVHGRGFDDQVLEAFYDRLPGAAESKVRSAVWSLSRDTAGMFVQFVTDASEVALKVDYLYEDTTMWHFPSTGVAGMDIYCWDEGNTTWRWVSTTHDNVYPTSTNQMLLHPQPSAQRRYRLHLPLYNGVKNLTLGIDSGSTIAPDSSYETKAPVVWYGTSIAQGGVASRPGMAFTNIIARAIGREVLNFGFSGNGEMEIAVAEFLVQVQPKPAAFVIDCNWNMDGPTIQNRTTPLVKFIRQTFPTTPIVLAEGTEAGSAWAVAGERRGQAAKRAALASSFASLHPTDSNLYYVRGEDLFNMSYDPQHLINPTVGGVHPSDLGQKAVADYYTRMLPSILPAEQPIRARPAPAAWQPAPLAKSLSPPQRLFHRKVVLAGFASEQHALPMPVPQASDSHDLRDLVIMGRMFNDTAEFYNRLPASAKGVVRAPVWSESQYNTGMFVAFETDASAISITYNLTGEPKPLWHMPASGTSGCDLFQLDAASGQYRFVGVTTSFPSPGSPKTIPLVAGLDSAGTTGRFLLFLPLRNTLGAGAIVVPAGSSFKQDPSFESSGVINGKKPVVWYGTSITCGGVASRPGSTFTNIMARNRGQMVLNYGFPGNGIMETSVMQFLVEIDAAVYGIDCLPNMGASSITKNTVPLVKFIRSKRPDTPIVLTAGTTYGDHWVLPDSNDSKRQALKTQYDTLIKAGVKNLYLMLDQQNQLFGGDWFVNPTVGGTHPSDLGHREIANFWSNSSLLG